jgi:hypothetical protein
MANAMPKRCRSEKQVGEYAFLPDKRGLATEPQERDRVLSRTRRAIFHERLAWTPAWGWCSGASGSAVRTKSAVERRR